MKISQTLVFGLLTLTAGAVVSLAGPVPATADQVVAQASSVPLSGTPEPTEEPTTPPSDAVAAAAAVGPEWLAYAKIVENASDFITILNNREDNGTVHYTHTFKLSSRKPNFARCEVTGGDGAGGVAVWRGGDKVQAHEGGEHKDIIVVLPKHNKRVTDLLGYGCGDTSPDRVVGYTTHNGKLSEAPGPLVNGSPTDIVTWVPNPGDRVRVAKEEFYISKTTHLIVETKGYYGADNKLVEESMWNIQVDPGLKYSVFDIDH